VRRSPSAPDPDPSRAPRRLRARGDAPRSAARRPRRPSRPGLAGARPAADLRAAAGRQLARDERLLLLRAEEELVRLHAREVARLLLGAAAIAGARSGAALGLLSPEGPPPAVAAWRRAARRALRLGRRDGLTAPGAQRLAELLALEPEDWGGPVVLVRAALAAGEDEGARVALGRALLVEGDLAAARDVFAALLRRPDELLLRWRALEGLALAHAALGRPRLALGAMEAAADDPACGVPALVGGLALAWRARDLRRTRRAAARLDLLVDPDEPAFGAALERLRRWLAREPPAARTAGARSGLRRLCRWLAREASPAGRVAWLLLSAEGA